MDHISSARNGGEKSIAILRGKVPAIRLYEIEERELDMLEKGMPASLFLNFGIALVSISCSFLIALLATHIASDRIFTVFTVIVTIGFIGGLVLMSLWYRYRQSTAALVEKIRSRIPDEETRSIDRDGDSK